ncbi:MAG: polysaccharide deacetylase family protein [Acidimicrobiales bacterium]
MVEAEELVTAPPLPMKRRVLFGLQDAMHWSGLGYAYVKARGIDGATILTYHSVAPPELATWIDPQSRVDPGAFESSMEFLARHRSVIALSELLDLFADGRTPPAGTVVLTFDDGYIDNATVVAPILHRLGLPSTWYLPTGMIERGESPWVDRLYTAFRTRTRHEWSFADGVGGAGGTLDLNDADERLDAYQRLAGMMIEAAYDDREALLREVLDRLQPAQTPPRLILSWDEVREVRRTYPEIDMGLHSTNHIDLGRFTGESARAEIEGCVADLRRELEVSADHFAFPYDRHSESTREMVRANGLRSAMGEGAAPLLDSESDRYAIARVGTPRNSTQLRFWTSGAYPGLSQALLRRA